MVVHRISRKVAVVRKQASNLGYVFPFLELLALASPSLLLAQQGAFAVGALSVPMPV